MKYTVTVKSPVDYISANIRPPNLLMMENWCNNTLQYPATCKWKFDYMSDTVLYHQTWVFESEEDAALFALTWL